MLNVPGKCLQHPWSSYRSSLYHLNLRIIQQFRYGVVFVIVHNIQRPYEFNTCDLHAAECVSAAATCEARTRNLRRGRSRLRLLVLLQVYTRDN